MKVSEIYEQLQKYIPVGTQEKWDNSGLLVCPEDKEVRSIVLSLDISEKAALYAAEKNADLIISHHPVIFEPRKSIKAGDPVVTLIRNNISAICLHTPLDMARGGMNEILYSIFKNILSLEDSYTILEPCLPDGRGFGFVCCCREPKEVKTAAEDIRKALDCADVRYCGENKIRKIAVCSGSGASMLEDAKRAGADTLITGDVKHDRWIAAADLDMCLIDCGHYFNERVCLPYLSDLLEAITPTAEKHIFDLEPYKVTVR